MPARHGLRSLIVVCCIQVATTPMAAQYREARAGFWFSGGATASWFPSAEHGFFLRAGVGRQYFTGDRPGSGPTERGRSIALGAGAGVDLLVTETLSLTPTLLLIHGRPGTTDVIGLPRRRELRTTVVGVSVGVTMY